MRAFPIMALTLGMLSASTIHAQTVDPTPPLIVSYDLTYAFANDPTIGGWTNTYSRLPVPTGWGDLVNFLGGNGTLDDGYIPTDPHNVNLLYDLPETTLTLHLAEPTRISYIDLYGGTMALNYAPGQLTSVMVTIGGSSVQLMTEPWGFGCAAGLCNDRLNLVGTGLDLTSTDTIFLSHFLVEAQPAWNYFSLAEVTVNGQANPVHYYANPTTNPIPEPNMAVLLLAGFGVLAWRRLNGVSVQAMAGAAGAVAGERPAG